MACAGAGWRPVCADCSQPRAVLVSHARDGLLVQVCRICFCCAEIRALAAVVEPDSPTLDALSDGLEVLYQVARAEIESADGAESEAAARASASRQGQGRREG